MHVIIRHPPVDVLPGTCYGQLDVPLSPGWEGLLEQVTASLQRIDKKHIGFIRIFHSPLQRCALPALQIAQEMKLATQPMEALMEMNFGDWEGQSYDELWEGNKEYQDWCKNWQSAVIPGGESYPQFESRIDRVMSLIRNIPSIIVTHAGVIRHMLESPKYKMDVKLSSDSIPYFEPIEWEFN